MTDDTIESKANGVLAKARELSAHVASWADFSNELFDPTYGLVAKTFEIDAERQAFYDSAQYRETRDLLIEVMKRTGVVTSTTPSAGKNGRLLARIPKTLHSSLAVEAAMEGVSLNQLVTAKLATPLRLGWRVEKVKVLEESEASH